ncbi:hypothetical protein [Nocardiopsis tropica]|uniref:Uncharacterized protein n=1 Tax=Nocardiopsis tropica TaxID=109330 RepID=A0ABV1ZWB5_9ACTN
MPPVDVTRPEPDPRNQQPLDNDFTVLIVPEAIPVPGTSVEVLQTAAANLRAAAEEVAEGGAGVESSWQALQAHYTAPESETLLAAMGPVARKGDTVLEDVTAVVTALETFAEEAESARTRLRNIRDDAVAFVEEVRDEEFWALNPWHYGKNRSLKLWANIVWATFQEAERECATAISAVNGQGNTYTAVGGEAPGPREVAYGLDPDEVPDIAFDLTEFSEWQRAGEEGWAHLTGSDKPWPLDWAADAFAAQQEHFGVGMAWGLGVGALSSTGLWRAGSGWAGSVGEAVDNAVTHKEETFQGYGALVGMYGEDGWMNPFDSEEGSGRTWRENAGAAWTEVGHDLFPWREWEDRPAYTLSTAGGNLALTVVAFPVRGGMLLSRIGGGGPDLPDIDVLERPGVAWEPGAAARPGFSLAQTLSGIRTGFSDTASGIGLRLDQLRTGVLARFAHWEVVEGAPESGGSGGPGTGPVPVPVHAGDGGVPDGRAGAPATAVPAGRGDDVGVAELVADVERYSGMDADARPAWLLAREEVPVGAGARGGGMEVPGGDGIGDRSDQDFRVTAAHDPDPRPATPASTPRDGSADIRAVPLHGDPAGASGPGSDGPARPVGGSVHGPGVGDGTNGGSSGPSTTTDAQGRPVETLSPGQNGYPENGQRFGDADDFELKPNRKYVLVDGDGATQVTYTTDVDGKISEIRAESQSPVSRHPEFLDPRPDVTYTVKVGQKEYMWQTNEFGRPFHAEGVLEHGRQKRNWNEQRAINAMGRRYFELLNEQIEAAFKADHDGRSPGPGEVQLWDSVQWNGGHVFGSSEFLGPGERLNQMTMLDIVNQERKIRPGIDGSYRRAEWTWDGLLTGKEASLERGLGPEYERQMAIWRPILDSGPKPPEIEISVTAVDDPNMKPIKDPVTGKEIPPPPEVIVVDWSLNGVRQRRLVYENLPEMISKRE